MNYPSLIILTKNIGINDRLSYEEIPLQILDREVHKLRTKGVMSEKFLCWNQFVEKAAWEDVEDLNKRYPNLFETIQVTDQGTSSIFSTPCLYT